MNEILAGKRIAVVYEWWTRFGGGESTTMRMAEALPGSELWTIKAEKGSLETLSTEIPLHETWVRHVIKSQNKFFLASLTPLALRNFSKSKFDALISSSHTFAHTARIQNLEIPHLSYIHTPSRQIWLPEVDDRVKVPKLARKGLQVYDKSSIRHIKSMVANSKNVKNRIEKFWGRDAEIIYPPVDISLGAKFSDLPLNQSLPFGHGEYIVTAGRLVKYKKHDIAIQVAQILNMPLVVMGRGPEELYLRKIAENSNVPIHFITAPAVDLWYQVLKNAHLILFLGIEDFGITPIEAISVGTPVIAFNAGGACEYIQPGKNGYLVDSLHPSDIASAVKMGISTMTISEMRKTVEIFDIPRFQKEIQSWVAKNL